MAGREWYDCQPCGIRYSDIMHDDCPECGNPDTTPTAPDTVIKLARLNDQFFRGALRSISYMLTNKRHHNARNAPAGIH
jgi:hypothetical protein